MVWRCAEPSELPDEPRLADATILAFLCALAAFLEDLCFATGAASSALATGAVAALSGAGAAAAGAADGVATTGAAATAATGAGDGERVSCTIVIIEPIAITPKMPPRVAPTHFGTRHGFCTA